MIVETVKLEHIGKTSKEVSLKIEQLTVGDVQGA